ncbi:ABC transporter substrate-binding protein [Roseomonas sp. OT10]|uniref:ABC transporter substrate-binding protein n=1 Tax=Roseomonas cutis TaxID=2897332 RepID=UPI001E6558EB|nr:ABC transporter substrate-binding protein [Roseomonas sp. OT10]UFN47612.1 ABC transporter substrate-binding protein [Roseomonas sp. OT10]
MTTRRALLAGSAGAVFAMAHGRWAEAQSPAGVIVMARQIDDLITLDPGECFEYSGSEVCGNVYQKLVTTPNSNPSELVGELAEKWEASADNKTFTFQMKEGPRFASGNPVTAEDAAWSFQRAVILNKSPAFIINQFGYTKDNVAQMIRATGPRTLVMQTAEPTSMNFLLYCLSAVVGSVVEKAAVLPKAQGDDLGNAWLKQNSAGSGPYQLRVWRASDSVTVEANPNSTVKAATRRVIMRHVADPSAQLLALQKGDVEIARNLSPDQIKQIAAEGRYGVRPQRKASLLFLALNQKNPNLAKAEVKQAIKLAIDYEGIANNITPNTWVVHQAFLPEGIPGALTEKPFSRRVDEAKKLMAAAGLANGFEMNFDYASAPPVNDIAQAVQANLADIGIRLRMLPGESRAVITKTRARQHDMAVSRWGSDYFDPHSNAENFSINTNNADDARQRTTAWRSSWLIPELSERTMQAMREPDPEKRAAMYIDLQRDHQKISPFVIMLQEIEVWVSRPGVTGLDTGPMNDRNRWQGLTKS